MRHSLSLTHVKPLPDHYPLDQKTANTELHTETSCIRTDCCRIQVTSIAKIMARQQPLKGMRVRCDAMFE